MFEIKNLDVVQLAELMQGILIIGKSDGIGNETANEMLTAGVDFLFSRAIPCGSQTVRDLVEQFKPLGITFDSEMISFMMCEADCRCVLQLNLQQLVPIPKEVPLRQVNDAARKISDALDVEVTEMIRQIAYSEDSETKKQIAQDIFLRSGIQLCLFGFLHKRYPVTNKIYFAIKEYCKVDVQTAFLRIQKPADLCSDAQELLRKLLKAELKLDE